MLIKRLLLWLFLSQWAGAIPAPIKTLEQLETYEVETAVKVSTARLVLVDYALVRRDFPHLALATKKAIDKWLLGYAGFMAETQVQKGVTNNTNTAIAIDSAEKILAYRPPKYGRALVIKTEDGLIDVKGAGAINPHLGHHSNGLGFLAEMIREFMFEKLVHATLKHGEKGDTIESYAVVDLGFRVNLSEETWRPAAQILRQAHVREIYAQRENEWAIEKFLREYGLTSGWDVSDDYLIMNIQYSKERALVDFGCYAVEQAFTTPLYYYGYSHNYPNQSLLVNDPQGPDGVQADPQKRVLFDKWNFPTDYDRFSGPIASAKTSKEFTKSCRFVAKYMKGALKDQKLFWQRQKVELTKEKPALENNRPVKKSRGLPVTD